MPDIRTPSPVDDRRPAESSAFPMLAAVAGTTLLIAAGIEASFRGEATPLATVGFVVGSSLVLAGAIAARRRLRELLVHRASLYEANNVLLVVTVAAILVVVNLFALRYSEHLALLPKYDLTRNQFFTLSPQTTTVLQGLDEPVTAIAFFVTPRGAGAAEKEIRTQRVQLENLLQLYSGASPRFSYRMVDPEKEPSTADKYGMSLSGSVVLERGDKRLVIQRWAIFQPADPIRNKPAAFTGEQALTNTLMRLVEATMPTVYFTVGHREVNLNDPSPEGLTELAGMLQRDHYRVLQLNLLQSKHIPADAACLVVAGPRQGFAEPEERVVADYLARGGNAVFLVDTGSPHEMFARLLEPFGVRVFRNFVVDLLNGYFNRPTWPIPQLNGHVITNELIRYGRVPTFPNAVALEKYLDRARYIIRTVAESSRQSWAETNFTVRRFAYDQGQDLQGPLMLAFAVTTVLGESADSSHRRESHEFRTVVVGDADFITNRAISMQANADFFLNCVAWVTGVADRCTIRPKEVGGEKIPLSAAKGEAIFYSCSLALPSLVLLVGGMIWWRRRNR